MFEVKSMKFELGFRRGGLFDTRVKIQKFIIEFLRVSFSIAFGIYDVNAIIQNALDQCISKLAHTLLAIVCPVDFKVMGQMSRSQYQKKVMIRVICILFCLVMDTGNKVTK